ncbi:MAG: chromosomal replication initiator protein DnaA [Deltaproteobacteria bacterium]|nr:chromosomal replication initiator protein DnaA [Deltaproteobacteria bacterium]MBW2324108.1 chromosomal replication initiator protein DnaA [Deltaproteobacteria bacterium]
MEVLWASVRRSLEQKLAEKNFRLWIDPLQPLKLEKQTVWLGCPNKFFLSWVKENYLNLIKEILKQNSVNGSSVTSVKLEIAPAADKKPVRQEKPAPRQYELPRLEVHQRAPLRFNHRFTFDRFIVGSGNNFAYSASMAMASDFDLNTDSLYLLSTPGLGKSHLSQAIGHYILSQNPNKNVLYLTAEDFTNEMVYSIKRNCLEEFKNKFRRRCDILVLEEVSFLSGKEKIQAELSYTLDCLMENKKKVVFTSSHLPKDIPRLRRNLVSRLNNGLISPIKPPDYETRLRILKAKAKENDLVIGDDVLDYMARRLTQDVRQLESCLCCLGAKSKLLSRRIDIDLAEEALGDLVEDEQTVDRNVILDLICRYYNVSVEELQSRSRSKSVVLPRNVGIYLFRETTDLSLEAIGQIFGRNHSTVLYSINTLKQRYRRDPKLKGQVDLLKTRLKSNLHLSS